MKKFTKDTSPWENKVNFVDKNNVLVGYDLSHKCCESAGYFITDRAPFPNMGVDIHDLSDGIDLEPYIFNVAHSLAAPDEAMNGHDLDEGRAVYFELNAPGLPNLYLYLYNCHNGYYAHGFEVSRDLIEVEFDYL